MSASLLRGWRIIRDVVLNPSKDVGADEAIAELALQQAPVVWMMGKVQSGKSSIVHAVTGHPAAEIGSGFRSCTRTSRIFDFPENAPVIRFLDTVGFDAVGYDPTDDLAMLEGHGHVLLAVVRAMDPAQDALLASLKTIRARRPRISIIVAQTTLHEGYPTGADHPPYNTLMTDAALQDLQRSLAHQARQFEALPGSGRVVAVPLDFTREEEGYAEHRYGLDALLDALTSAGAEGMKIVVEELSRAESDGRPRRARGHIIGYATVAGISDTLPLVGAISVPTVQGKLLHSIGRIYGVKWDARTIREFAGSLGAGTVLGIGLSMGARQLGKLIPGYGQTIGAAAAGVAGFAVTYALGTAACHYLGMKHGARSATFRSVHTVYEESLKEALLLVRDRLPRRTRDGSGGEGR